MKRVGVAAVALLTVLGWSSDAGAAGCASAIEDPAGVLAASSRLTGAVAALERLDVGVTIVVGVDAQHPGLAASCSGSAGTRAGTVMVDLHGQPLSASVRSGGSVSQQLAQRAQREMLTRLRATPADAPSAVAHGLELVWQEQDQRGDEASAPRDEVADLAPEAVRTLPSAATVRLVNQMMLAVAAGVAAGTACLAGARLVARRRLLRSLRSRAQVCRSDLAERYVDLDTRVATIVTTIGHCTAHMDATEATRALQVAAERRAAVEAAALQAGAELLATPADLQQAPKAQAADVADRCAGALAQLEEAILLLSRSAVDAGDASAATPALSLAQPGGAPAPD